MAIPRRDLTLVERTVMNTLRTMFEATEGYYGAFDEEMIRHRGLGEYLKSLVYLSKHWIRLNKFFGAENTHILAFYSSMWNGCIYCGYGHLYAHNVNLFARTGQLFPLDEQDLQGRRVNHDQNRLRDLERSSHGTHTAARLRRSLRPPAAGCAAGCAAHAAASRPPGWGHR